MIFKIDGSVSELLALTPVIRQWKSQENDKPIYVETYLPEVFFGNPDIEKAGECLDLRDGWADVNMIRWHELEKSVTETYADNLLGHLRLDSWRPVMFCSREEQDRAAAIVGSIEKPAAVGFDTKMIDPDSWKGVITGVRQAGFEVVEVSRERLGSWGTVFAAIRMCQLFVGSDGDVASVAMTTDVPAVVCYSYRSPVYFPPFRGLVPFVGLVPDASVCDQNAVCHARNGKFEFSRMYFQGCSRENKFCCMKRELTGDVVSAISKLFLRA